MLEDYHGNEHRILRLTGSRTTHRRGAGGLEFAPSTIPVAHPGHFRNEWRSYSTLGSRGRRKRNGGRVIYVYLVSAEVVALLSECAKNDQEKLTNEDKKTLRSAAEDEHGPRRRCWLA